MKKELAVTPSSGNIFADLGLPNADEHLLKAQIVAMIGDTIKRQRLTQTETARRIGIAQPDVSKLIKGRYEGFSLERLLGFLMMLGHGIKIEVEPANENNGPGHLQLARA